MVKHTLSCYHFVAMVMMVMANLLGSCVVSLIIIVIPIWGCFILVVRMAMHLPSCGVLVPMVMMVMHILSFSILVSMVTLVMPLLSCWSSSGSEDC